MDFTRQRGQQRCRNERNKETPIRLECYPQGYQETPPALGDYPIPQFPFEWEPEEKDFQKNNPFAVANFALRRKSSEKIVEGLEEWENRLKAQNSPKADRIRRLKWRVKDCDTLSVGMDGRKVAQNQTGAAYFKSVQRCNSRFCPRCARKAGRKALERIFVRTGIDPENCPYSLRFLTLTMPGDPGAPLKDRYDKLRKALKRLYRSKIWSEKVEGSIGKIEVTKNADNWHVHAHFLINGDYLPNKELRKAWAKALKTDEDLIHYPWIERPKKGKGAFLEIAKYIAKPVSFLGAGKSRKTDSRTGAPVEGRKAWTNSEMVEFFEVFQGARIFMTTGNFKEKDSAQNIEKEQSKWDKIEEIANRCPINLEAAKNGQVDAIAEIVFDAGIEGYTKTEVITKLSFMVFEPDELTNKPPDHIKKWSPDPKRIDEARKLSAIEWERRRAFRMEIKRAREELRYICERNGMHW